MTSVVYAAPKKRQPDYTLQVRESAYPSSCGFNTCCIPGCETYLDFGPGSNCENSHVSWAGSCVQNYENPQGTQDIANCDGYEMT
ncbi:hypothetical protein MMYC01_208897 [Madurella mycetomatis]|uniref:Uncharacterized protein n=1 Tax=Madurella mycetomatis TaxID=100816 RepID=A0A175VUC8_9PEZI|nr:hypothetical protein MMYC01_208897 [Madurella mycetomatis]